MTTTQNERLAAESAEEREARLLRASANQRQRRAVESSQLTRSSREEPFKQRSVQLKMRKFHEHFASISSPKCSTCLKCFPGIQLYASTTECMRCYRDKHTPKVYSAANNMNPGPLPPQLKVSSCVCLQQWCELIKGNSKLRMTMVVLLIAQGLTQVEEMLISAVLPIMSLYKLPHGQYAYSGHVINLPQDIAGFCQLLASTAQ